jgi:nicotinate-nucleotide pyrophosphorylase (carboxylating)
MEIPMDAVIKTAKSALKEDAGGGDITTEALIPAGAFLRAVIIARQSGIIAGLPAAGEVFRMLDKDIKFDIKIPDGAPVRPGQPVAEVSGSARAVLTGERTALNIIGRLSGIATAAGLFAKKAGKYGVKIMDTRKTSPGLRALEKYAVSAGGGHNHRMGLYDAVLIKDNHIYASGKPIRELVEEAREKTGGRVSIEAEVSDLDELRDALVGEPDIILLDNMTPETVGKAVKIARKKSPSVLLEVSGNITLSNVEEYAASGADMISVGALTHSVKNFDFSLAADREL